MYFTLKLALYKKSEKENIKIKTQLFHIIEENEESIF